MVDYAKLAEKARALQDAAKDTNGRAEGKKQNPSVFFNSVKTHLIAEMHKANAELTKRGVATLDRSFSPSFSGRFCFTFGTSLFCSVELVAPRAGQPRIKAVISGPPNGGEIGRREYLFNLERDTPEPQSFRTDESAGVIVTGLNPQDTAIDIISCILTGEFS